MRCEVLAIGTELLLGQIVDTNSSWIGEQLAAAGVESYEHRQVGDNLSRMVRALTELLSADAGSDAVIVCGGLGPTPDDLTREALAQYMGVELVRDLSLIAPIIDIFTSRGMDVPENNLRQADVPVGGVTIPNSLGTAPGLCCEVSGKVVYAVPGVPYEMQAMVNEFVIPDLLRRSGVTSVIRSRSLKTWGASESGLAEMISDRVEAQTNPTIAFLARGIEGIVVRITAKGSSDADAGALIESEERELRSILGSLVFGVDDETMEHVVLTQLEANGWTLGVAESLTGGLLGARIVSVPHASRVFRGTIGAYATEVKRSVLGVTSETVVSEACAIEMAEGARRVLRADVGLAVTGVAGPDPQDGQPVGTVCLAVALPDRATEAVSIRLPGDRDRIQQYATITAMNLLRTRLDATS